MPSRWWCVCYCGHSIDPSNSMKRPACPRASGSPLFQAMKESALYTVGNEVTKVEVGQRVVPFLRGAVEQGNGSWQEYVAVPADLVWPVPASMATEAAAQFVMNPWTAFGLVQYLQVPSGEFLLQTAAGSV